MKHLVVQETLNGWLSVMSVEWLLFVIFFFLFIDETYQIFLPYKKFPFIKLEIFTCSETLSLLLHPNMLGLSPNPSFPKTRGGGISNEFSMPIRDLYKMPSFN